MQGKIIRGIAGFYYVHVVNVGHCVNDEHVVNVEHCNQEQGETDVIYECKAKGVFRRNNEKPLVGDNVELTVLDEENKKGNITAILPRENALIRPAVANVDQALVIFSTKSPEPNYNLLDRFLLMMEQNDVPCIICFNKADLVSKEELQRIMDIYKETGYPCYAISVLGQQGLEEIIELLQNKTTTVAGPSGVGKSSFINCLQQNIQMETGSISTKIERGKHTTRHTELIAINHNSYILDTPGFSSLAVFDCEKEDVREYYPEFTKWEPNCRFGGCVHVNEPDCGIKAALQEGKISPIRYENYLQIYEECSKKKKY